MINNINRICEALNFVPANDRDVWLKMAMAIKSEMGELGFDSWDEWSRQDDTYNAREEEKIKVERGRIALIANKI